jgi:hypothetical protein
MYVGFIIHECWNELLIKIGSISLFEIVEIPVVSTTMDWTFVQIKLPKSENMKSNLQDTLYATGAEKWPNDWFTNDRHWRHTLPRIWKVPTH